MRCGGYHSSHVDAGARGKELQIVDAVQKDTVLMTSDSQAEIVCRCGAGPIRAAGPECNSKSQGPRDEPIQNPGPFRGLVLGSKPH